VRRLVILLLLAAVVLLVVSAVQVVKASKASQAVSAVGPASAVIVVGTATSGDHVTGELQARCAQALALWRAHRAPVVITTGASSAPGSRTEASLAGTWLVDHGFPARQLVMVPDENLSTAFAFIARRYGKSSGGRTIIVGAPLQVLWLRNLASADGLDAQISPVSASKDSLMTDVRKVWFQAIAVGLGRVIGFDHTQGFGT